SSDLLHLFRPELLVVNENFRLAGSDLARSVLGWIGGAAPGSLQRLVATSEVRAFSPPVSV
ncbi:LacI family transcriptional regulator, partial [Mesorhizobium sp. M7A.F.Ca.CA.004.06.1.1]